MSTMPITSETLCGPGICVDCLMRWAKDRPATATVYCWRNGVASFPDHKGSCSLSMFETETLVTLHARGVL